MAKIQFDLQNGTRIVSEVSQVIAQPSGTLIFYMVIPPDCSNLGNYQPIKVIETEPIDPATRKTILSNFLSGSFTDLGARGIRVVNCFC